MNNQNHTPPPSLEDLRRMTEGLTDFAKELKATYDGSLDSLKDLFNLSTARAELDEQNGNITHKQLLEHERMLQLVQEAHLDNVASIEEYKKGLALVEKIVKLKDDEEKREKDIQRHRKMGLPVSEMIYEKEKASVEHKEASAKLALITQQISEEEYETLRKKLILDIKVAESSALLHQNTQSVFADITGIKNTYPGAAGLITNLFAGPAGTGIEGIAAGLRGLKTGFMEMITPAAILGKILTETFQMVAAYDKAFTDFNRATGMVIEFKGAMSDARSSANEFGVSIGDAAESTKALATGWNRFSELNQGVQSELIATSAKLTKVGVDAGNSAANIRTFTLGMGMGAIEANQHLEKLAVEGVKLGVGTVQLGKDFQASKEYILAYGQEGEKHFMAMAKHAKETGVEVTKLMKIHNDLADISKAAQLAGDLAIMAGRQVIDPIALIGMNPQEKIKAIRDATQQLGLTNRSTYQDWQFAAKAVGMTVEDLKATMNGQATSSDKAAQREADLNKIIKESITIVDTLKAAFQTLATAVQPLLAVVRAVVTAFSWFMNLGDELMGKVVAWTLFIILATVKLWALGTTLATLATSLKLVALAQWLWNASLLACPLMWIVIGILAVGASVALLLTYWDEISEFFSNIFSWFEPGKWFDAGANIIRGIVDGISSAAGEVWEAMKDVASDIADFFPWSPVKAGPLMGLPGAGKRILEQVGQGIGEGANYVIAPMRQVASNINNEIVGGDSNSNSSSNLSSSSNSNSSNYSNMIQNVATKSISNSTSAANNNISSAVKGAINSQTVNSSTTNNNANSGSNTPEKIVVFDLGYELRKFVITVVNNEINIKSAV